MTEVVDIQRLMERAEGAAHDGDFVAAEEVLRRAVELQERTLGSSSPEVASTLNNLGIVYERLDRPADAEACYRKSFAIAKAAFGRDHPLVETSETNLREFCDARGIPFDPPAPVSAPVIDDAIVDPIAIHAPLARERTIEPAISRSRTPFVIGAIVLAVLIAAVMVMSRRAPSPAPQVSAPVAIPAPPVSAPPAPAPAASQSVAAAPPPTVAAPVSKAASAPPPRQERTPVSPVSLEVLDARLCQSLDVQTNWRCDPLPGSTAGGPVFFLTRLKAASDTSVEHRWYRNDKLAQSVTLRVRGTGSGYRTYSRTTTGADRPGTWRVELRSAAGEVLAQETFVVGPS